MQFAHGSHDFTLSYYVHHHSNQREDNFEYLDPIPQELEISKTMIVKPENFSNKIQ